MHDHEDAAPDRRPRPADPAPQPVERRDFLRVTGFSLAALGLAGCAERRGEPPLDREAALPAVQASESAVPGRPEYYASTCGGCRAGCGVLVKCRDGRPIKIEGLPEHPLSRGGLCPAGQAQVLAVYDGLRPTRPTAGGQPVEWAALDDQVAAGLARARAANQAVWLLTDSRHGPTDRWLIQQFRAATGAYHAVVDGLSTAAITAAHQQTHGQRILPRYRFDRATAIAAFDADFLGTWLSPVEYTAGYGTGRQPAAGGAYSFHAQVESRLSLTGCNADLRQTVAPSALAGRLADLLARVALRLGVARQAVAPDAFADEVAARLTAARARALVVCGRNDLTCQLLTNQLNLLLGGYGTTLDLEGASFQQYGDESALAVLAAEIDAGRVGALFVAGPNPVYELPDGAAWAKRLAAVPLTVSLATRADETAAACRLHAPELHALEAWGDAEPVNGLIGLQQPVVSPLRAGRSLAESLAAWLGQPAGGQDLTRAAWAATVLPRVGPGISFEAVWQQALTAGFVAVLPAPLGVGAPRMVAATAPPATTTGLELVLYAKAGPLDGRGAWNPWLQELPDPISKVAWDNYASFGPATAQRLQLRDGDEVTLTAGRASLTLPAVVQVGQDERTVAVALGYGHSASRRFSRLGPRWFGARPSVGADGLVGVNAAPWRGSAGGLLADCGQPVQVQKTGRRRPLAKSQIYDSLQVPAHLAPSGGGHRPIVQATTLAAFQRDPRSSDAHHAVEHDASLTLWGEDHAYHGRHWAMVIDLNACTGCSACVLACQIENNVPVVGRDEVTRRRELHWLRLDRYLDPNGEHLDISHQPMLCHHCGNAPCEVVCPVLATVHSAEGLNQQVYNRCVGTRYCANNCPYKVRRFNWFDYPRDDETANLVLNPDVAVRSRGVMEKCTFCVQRLEAAKAESRRTGRPLTDADVQPACAQSCPARAIVFGDRNDPQSAVAKALADPRRYVVLEELGIEPAVSYLRIVRNRPETRHG